MFFLSNKQKSTVLNRIETMTINALFMQRTQPQQVTIEVKFTTYAFFSDK